MKKDDTMKLLGTIGQMETKELTKILYVEQTTSDRKFNLNDVRGNIEIDQKSDLAIDPKKDAFGNLLDWDGKRINKYGYLIDVNWNIVDRHSDKILFKKEDLNKDGDIPALFKIEGGNFSPFDIIGNLKFDANGKPMLEETKEGKLVDADGK